MSIEEGLKTLLTKGVVKTAKLNNQFFHPQLAKVSEAIPTGNQWVFETKFDGYRILAVKQHGKIMLRSRNGLDWTHRFSDVATALDKILAESFVIDGELVVLGKNGATSFGQLQKTLSTKSHDDFTYFAFDLIYLNGIDLRSLLLIGRKKILEHLLGDLDKLEQLKLRFSKHSEADGPERFARACRSRLEGIMAKNALAEYKNKRTSDWLKIRCHLQAEFVIGGFTNPEGTRKYFGSLLMGAYDQERNFIYTGKVGTGFNRKMLHEIKQLLEKIQSDVNPFASPMTALEKRGAHYVKLRYIAQLSYTEWTPAQRLRHPVFLGLREDKPAKEVQV